jgi:omega-6 fatty acid desaturase (delta-12 desaturase)
MTRDEVFVPRTREQRGYPAPKEEAELTGFKSVVTTAVRRMLTQLSVSEKRQEELREAIGDAPVVLLLNLFAQQLFGWPLYLLRNASGQRWYPANTNRECSSEHRAAGADASVRL